MPEAPIRWTVLIRERLGHRRGERWGFAALAFLPVLAWSTPSLAQQPAAVTAFIGVNVVPMDRERVLQDQTVLVQGDRILTVAPAAEVRVPTGAVTVDGRGKWLLPGLGNMHVHLPQQDRAISPAAVEQLLLRFLAQGVTTIRNMDGRLWHLQVRRAVADGAIPGPRIYTAGPIIGQKGDASTPAAAVQTVLAQHAAGYDFIKIYDHTYSREAFDSVIATARRLGMPYAGHVPGLPHGLALALAVHFASLEHLFYGYPKALLQANGDTSKAGFTLAKATLLTAVGRSRYDTLAAATQRAGVWNVPTVAALGRLFNKRLQPFAAKLLAALHDAGAGILLGTDGDGFQIPVVEELQALVAAGVTPYQALASGTRNVAEFFGALDTMGTVAAGKRADLVLLDGNPLEDVGRVASPAGVMVGGRWLSKAAIDRWLDSLRVVSDTDQQGP